MNQPSIHPKISSAVIALRAKESKRHEEISAVTRPEGSAHVPSAIAHLNADRISQDARLVELGERLKRKDTLIQTLQDELEEIHSARAWKLLRTYARLKAFFKVNPKTAFKNAFHQAQIVGPSTLARHALGSLIGTGNGGNGHPGALKLPPPAAYENWLSLQCPTLETLLLQRQEVLTWEDRPLISLIIPVYNTQVPWLQRLLCSVSDQTYDRWETLLVDDHSSSADTVAILRQKVNSDRRFKLIERLENGGISAACQEGLEAASGLFAAVVDHDDILEPDALYQIASRLRSQPEVDVIYSDEALMDVNGNTIKVVFRPDYSYHRLMSHPYIVHLTAFRRRLALSVGGFDLSYVTSQDYDLLLRMAAVTDRFVHIPRVLYRWRQHEKSAGHQKMNKVMKSSIRALQNHLSIKNVHNAEVEPGLSFNFFRVRYPLQDARIAIIIPTRDRADLLERCIASIERETELPSHVGYQIIIADNASKKPETFEFFRKLQETGHRVVSCPGPFNFSRINNRAARKSDGDILLFLNNDVEIIEAGWLAALVEYAQRPKVGAVGAKLIYPNGLIQHAGVILGLCQSAGHSHQFFPEHNNWRPSGGHMDELLCVRECMAVTAACLMVRRDLFEKAGGFDEKFVVGFGDTDLCLRIREAGFSNIWTPYARLVHYESASRGKKGDDLHLHPEDIQRLKARWDPLIQKGDPYYNPNLSIWSNNFLPKE